MSLTTQHIEEGLSRAYVSAVAFHAGVNLGLGDLSFDYGLDGCFKGINIIGEKRAPSGITLDFQLKATVDWTETPTHIGYSIKSAAHDKLAHQMNNFRAGQGITPIVLILLCLPPKQVEWLEIDEKQLLLRKCCYFHFVEGDLINKPDTSKKIEIHRSNQLTPKNVRDLMDKIRNRAL